MIEVKLASMLKTLTQIESHEDLQFLNKAIIDQMRFLSAKAARKWQVGDQVEFSNKRGNREQGQIVKINPKRIVVQTLLGTWKVPAAMLRSIRG